MCGVAGVIGNHNKEWNRYKQMLEVLNHRGPDGTGEYVSKDESVWLGHKRLAIIAPEEGEQPLCNEEGSIWITFNGCIYNYLELTQALRQKGHAFKTHTDTEVIVHAYEEYGEDCIYKFIGMFAFAIWNEKDKELFCARDRLGIKPFYYWNNDSLFVFSSEIKALLSTKLFNTEVYEPALQEYIIFQAPITEKTFFKNVYRLMPGHIIKVNKKGKIIYNKKYWDVSFSQDLDHDESYFIDNLRLLLNDAVKLRMRSDVPLGTHLSGGLDSSTIACIAQRFNFGGEPLQLFTGAFKEGREFDESGYAKTVADYISGRLNISWPSANDFMETLPKIIYYMDEPAAGPGIFPQYIVSKLASEKVKVILGGQGGDEVFAGYARYLIGYLEECLKGAIEKTDHTANYAATLASIIPALPMLQQYIPMLRNFWADGLFDTQQDRYFRLMNRSSDTIGIYNNDLFSSSSLQDIRDSFNRIFSGSNASSFLNKMLYFDSKVHLPALLHVEDRTSMAWGLESRVPLLDHRIFEFMAAVPPVIKFKNGMPKYLFRKAIHNIIPDVILNREEKMGFPVPLHKWYAGELRGFILELLLDKKAKERGIFNYSEIEKAIVKEQSFSRIIWGALCIELWYKTFIDV